MNDLADAVVEYQDSYDVADATMVRILAEFIEQKNLGEEFLNALELQLNPE